MQDRVLRKLLRSVFVEAMTDLSIQRIQRKAIGYRSAADPLDTPLLTAESLIARQLLEELVLKFVRQTVREELGGADKHGTIANAYRVEAASRVLFSKMINKIIAQEVKETVILVNIGEVIEDMVHQVAEDELRGAVEE
jgi:hypothetical protein